MKKEIDTNIRRKKGLIGNIIYQAVKIGTNIFNLVATKNPNYFLVKAVKLRSGISEKNGKWGY